MGVIWWYLWEFGHRGFVGTWRMGQWGVSRRCILGYLGDIVVYLFECRVVFRGRICLGVLGSIGCRGGCVRGYQVYQRL